ncbi:TnpA family transposase [Paraburkholderia atlantica]|uniref:TnpA family transposase n=1 Tax=Paraburkholderia atlantica TaxID=2654982 RepID=A0A7W8QG98_PARAM|nr:TnpA family transposase [Paraburkholderia atlantica]
MPRRTILSPAERDSLFSFPESHDEIIRHYTFNEADRSLIGQHRGAANRLGYAVQLCCMRYPGVTMGAGVEPPPALLEYVAGQLGIEPMLWTEYAKRDQTRREHLLELQSALQLRLLTVQDYRPAVQALVDLAMQTDKGLVLAQALV